MTMTDIDEAATEPADPAPAVKEKKSPKGQQARYAAIQRLLDNHREEFTHLYEEEAARLGVRTKAAQLREKREKLLAQLQETEKELAAHE
jgi:hypothetical protein